MDVNVDFVVNKDVAFTADLTVETAIKEHKRLSGRDEQDQHPISAITGLEDALKRLDTYIHEQGESSDTWVIVHNLNKYPSITIVDSAGTVFEAEIRYDSENQCTVLMNGAFKGKAYLN